MRSASKLRLHLTERNWPNFCLNPRKAGTFFRWAGLSILLFCGGIYLPDECACKISYVDMQTNYMNMQHNYFDLQLLSVNVWHIYVNMQHRGLACFGSKLYIYFIIQFGPKTGLAPLGRSMPPCFAYSHKYFSAFDMFFFILYKLRNLSSCSHVHTKSSLKRHLIFQACQPIFNPLVKYTLIVLEW